MKRLIGLYLLLMFCMAATVAGAQQVFADTTKGSLAPSTDTLSQAMPIQPADTLTPQALRPLVEGQQWRILDSLTHGFYFQIFDLQKIIDSYKQKSEHITYQTGRALARGDVWILVIIAVLLVLFAILKNTFSKQLWAVVQSFYSNRALSSLNKEEDLMTSRSFLLLFVQFGFTIGLFFYLAARYQGLPQANGGFEFFLVVSVSVIVLYLLKIVALRVLAFVFHLQKPIGEYISILYLSYFNASLLFIPLVVMLALSPIAYSTNYLIIGIGLLLLIFVFQFFRATLIILSQYHLPKMYLFLYFCTLEICPILILIKAIGL